MRELIDLHPEVADALAHGRPVVAFESTIISHGMPYPDNAEMARRVEAIARAQGAVPATIALADGRCKVGLTYDELERLAGSPDAAKVSLRDMPIIIARRTLGATTVASTAMIAEAAGIKVFVTGGIGGVHRGMTGQAAQMWDVSADLMVLGNCSTTVVSAGAKSVLDIPATLEVLEMLGVTILGYGTDRFPGFWTRDSGHGVDARVDSPEAVAAVIRARTQLGLRAGILVVNPLPEVDALPAHEVEGYIETVLAEMAAQGVSGKAITPFMLARIKALSGGRTLSANLKLVYNNALVGAQIATAIAEGA